MSSDLNTRRSDAGGAGVPLDGVIEEAVRLVAAAEQDGVLARLLGGTAIQIVARAAGRTEFAREPLDIDMICGRDAGSAMAAVLRDSGYRADEQFNAFNGHRRLLFFDDPHERQLDVFVAAFSMCHALPIGERLGLESLTLPLAELLMMKLQIVELNTKDQTDIFALLLCADVGDHDRGVLNGRYIAKLCAADWGLWRTVTLNLERTHRALAGLGTGGSHVVIRDKVARLEAMIEETPKTRRWRLRAKVGERVRWYEEPEEVA